jgi:glycosyltransferase involved in cell wall biosynthesis
LATIFTIIALIEAFFRNILSSVKILLCCFNGQHYLPQQLDSIAQQSHQDWSVIASDDGSSDDTLAILQSYQQRWGADKLQIRPGPRAGFAQNFLSLASDASLQADYYAYCDQDDIWLPEKLSRAISQLQDLNAKQALLYCGRTRYINHQLQAQGYSTLFKGPFRFANALVQCVAGGNTMLFNQALKNLLQQAGQVDVASHDWWTYQLATGSQGQVVYDAQALVLYRQHDAALVGSNIGIKASIKRIRQMLAGDYRAWNDLNIAALLQCQHLLTPQHQVILQQFSELRKANWRQRLSIMHRCGLYRQDAKSHLALYLAAMLNKL